MNKQNMIPFIDLKIQYLSLKNEIDGAIEKVVNNCEFILGEEVELFEREFACFCNVKYAVGTSSGTSALHLALKACGVKEGDEVITTPATFTATAEAIWYLGAKPVFVDIDLRTYNLDTSKIEEAITHKTKAIIPVHLYGRPVDMDSIMELSDRYNLKVVEDAAQAHGAIYKGRKVGTIGHVGCFSFYPGKNLGAYGDAGIAVTNNKDIADKIRLLHNHGRNEKYTHLMRGYGYRLDTIQAAVLRCKLKRLQDWNRKRQENACLYKELLKDVKDIILPEKDLASSESVYHLFVIRNKKRDTLQKFLLQKGIKTGIHYPIPLHLQPAYSYLGKREGDFPKAEIWAKEVLSLAMYPELSKGQIEYICESISEFFCVERINYK